MIAIAAGTYAHGIKHTIHIYTPTGGRVDARPCRRRPRYRSHPGTCSRSMKQLLQPPPPICCQLNSIWCVTRHRVPAKLRRNYCADSGLFVKYTYAAVAPIEYEDSEAPMLRVLYRSGYYKSARP